MCAAAAGMLSNNRKRALLALQTRPVFCVGKAPFASQQ